MVNVYLFPVDEGDFIWVRYGSNDKFSNIIIDGGTKDSAAEYAELALDLIMTVKYETGCTNIAVNKGAIINDFFVLSTCLAGEILQKFINYGVRFAIYGDFSKYTSKPLKDFMYESNKGKDIYFQPTASLAVDKLSGCDDPV